MSWDWTNLATDAVVATALVVALGALCEWWLRYREMKRKETKRKQEGPRPPSATGAGYNVP
jgi:hypothetical protein